MPAQGIVAVVEIERVRRGAVDQRRVERARAVGAAEHKACARRGRNDPAENSRGRLHAAGDRDADGIEDADLGPMHRLRGQILEPQCGGSAGKFVCELHAAPAAPASRAKTAMRRVPPGSLK